MGKKGSQPSAHISILLISNFFNNSKNGLDYDNNRTSNNNNINKKEDNVNNAQNQFISIIKFFSNCFYSQTNNKILIDYIIFK